MVQIGRPFLRPDYVDYSIRGYNFSEMDTPHLSLIIPARNEERRLPKTLQLAEAFLQVQPYTSEIIIVENASTDRTAEVAQAFAAGSPRTRVLKENQPGKGLAVCTGMLAAHGAFRFMADADLSMPITEIPRFLDPELAGYDIVIGSREAPGAVRYGEPEYRHFGGRVVNLMIRLFALPGLHDTQCGFKLFTAAAAKELFSRQTINGWSFDIEILFLARQHGLKIYELPIPWYFAPDSKVHPVKDAARMFTDILRIRKNARKGLYN